MPKYPVVWSDEAKQTSKDIALYIFQEWGLNSSLSFSEEIEKLVARLSENDKLCPKSNLVNFRKCVVSKQTSLVYRILGGTVELVTFIDNRSSHSY